MTSLTRNTVIVAVPVLDELEGDGGSVVYLGSGDQGRVVRLTQIGAAVRSACVPGIRLADLATHLSDLFGLPPGGDDVNATRAQVEDLRLIGLLDVVIQSGDP